MRGPRPLVPKIYSAVFFRFFARRKTREGKDFARALERKTREGEARCSTGGTDISTRAVNVDNENPSLDALGKLTHTNPRAMLSGE